MTTPHDDHSYAYYPHTIAHIATDADNAQRMANAAAELRRRHIHHLPGDGRATDGTHGEPGFAVALSRDAARALAVQWEQSAFFWIDGGSVWLYPALVPGEATRLTER